MDIAVAAFAETENVRFLFVSIFLGVCGIQDLRSMKISLPAAFAAGGAAAVLDIRACLLGNTDVLYWLAALVPGVFLLLLSFLAEGSAGKGDGICFLVLGGYLGCRRTTAVLFAALLLASICGLVLLILHRAGRKTRLPFLAFASAAWAGYTAARLAGVGL